MNDIRIKPDKCVVKIRDNDNNLIDSVIIPTDIWYLPDNSFKVFTHDNTKQCQDELILKAFDSVQYQIGMCHTNTDNLIQALKNNGIEAKYYSGWLFTEGNKDYPIWHSWCVVDDYVLDLSDNYYTLYGLNGDKFVGKSVEEQRELNADFLEFALRNWSNSQRCTPVGKVWNNFIYVGVECNSGMARKIYNDLIAKYPNHKMQSDTNADGYNQSQEEFRKRGLM